MKTEDEIYRDQQEQAGYFDRICGYEEEKKELMYLCDILRNPDAYTGLGAALPHNVLLCGVPGVGKTLMAECLIEASGRQAFRCRKADAEEDFIEHINKIFEAAAEAAPSIILLDDMDKYAGFFYEEAPEFAAVQACIDEVQGRDVFVIATINDSDDLSDSLIRPGRFDRYITVDIPDADSAAQIITRYFRERKDLSPEISIEELTDLTAGMTAVEIMTLANEAGVYAGYERADAIGMRHIVKAYVSRFDNIRRDSSSDDEHEHLVACHEAGHAVISEVLEPGSVALVFSREVTSRSGGLMSRGRRLGRLAHGSCRAEVLTALGGRAATELVFGRPDNGALQDLRAAYNSVEREVCGICLYGLEYAMPASMTEESDERRNRRDMKIRDVLERYYSEDLSILKEHREFLDRMTDELLRKGYLFREDIAKIRLSTGMNRGDLYA